MKILTVVVPSYNTEKYVDECLPTIITKNSINDIEILLISDGSTDGTLRKLRQYELQYPNSIRVIDKENGGHGSVINRGVQEAAGIYLKVIDGDDWVYSENFDKLVKELKTTDVDLVLNPYCVHNIVTKKETIAGKAHVKSGERIKFDDVTDRLPLLALHGITYKTELLRENRIRFQEKCFYEDAEYDIYPVLYIKTMMYLDFPVYVYRVGSLTQSVNPKNAVKNKDMLNTIVNNLIEFYSCLPSFISESRKAFISNQICHIIQNMYGIYLKMPISREAFESIQQFDQELKTRSEELYNASATPAIKALRMNSYPIFMLGVKLFEIKRRKRGF